MVRLKKNGSYINEPVHNIIASVFVKNNTHSDVVIHKDGDILNNNADNLQYKKWSIVSNERECFICRRIYQLTMTEGLELHHMIHGTANRKNSDRLGLTVYLCHHHHRLLHDKGEFDDWMMQTAQESWQKVNGKGPSEWRAIFGKSFL